MTYVKIEWIHDFVDTPEIYLIEIGYDGYETKKIEKFKGGLINFASDTLESGTFLSPEPFGEIEIYNFTNESERMKAYHISELEFYNEWNKITSEIS